MSRPLEVGSYELDGETVTVESVSVRNWSTVAVARTGDDDTIFLKQFRDATGDWRPQDLQQELDGQSLLNDSDLQSVVVAEPVLTDRENLVIGYDWVDISTIDELVRNSPSDVAAAAKALADAAISLVDELAALPHPGTLKRRERDWPSAQHVLCPKGLDYRNLGWNTNTSAPLLFDAGPVQVTPIEEATAKLICSALLINFGHPVTRTLRGVNLDLASIMAVPLLGRCNRQAIDYELARLRRHRQDEPKGASLVERIAIRPASALLMSLYWRSMSTWLDQHESQFGQPQRAPTKQPASKESQ